MVFAALAIVPTFALIECSAQWRDGELQAILVRIICDSLLEAFLRLFRISEPTDVLSAFRIVQREYAILSIDDCKCRTLVELLDNLVACEFAAAERQEAGGACRDWQQEQSERAHGDGASGAWRETQSSRPISRANARVVATRSDAQHKMDGASASAPRFAVCVCGDTRGFSAIAWALERRLIHTTSGRVDLFFHLWSDGSPLEAEGVAAARRLPGVVSVVVEPTEQRANLTALTYGWSSNRRMSASGSFEAFRSQWRKVHLCFEQAFAHARYDAYIRTRADTLHLI